MQPWKTILFIHYIHINDFSTFGKKQKYSETISLYY